jgi:hypothetical protein
VPVDASVDHRAEEAVAQQNEVEEVDVAKDRDQVTLMDASLAAPDAGSPGQSLRRLLGSKKVEAKEKEEARVSGPVKKATKYVFVPKTQAKKRPVAAACWPIPVLTGPTHGSSYGGFSLGINFVKSKAAKRNRKCRSLGSKPEDFVITLVKDGAADDEKITITEFTTTPDGVFISAMPSWTMTDIYAAEESLTLTVAFAAQKCWPWHSNEVQKPQYAAQGSS